MLISYDPLPTSFSFMQIQTSPQTGSKYLCSFDLNALDMNDQTGLYAAVVANRNEICEYLLNLKLRKLNDQDVSQYEHQASFNLKIDLESSKKQAKSRTSSILSNKSSVSGNGADAVESASGSFFDHLKNVFLDIKSYDPYVINYTANLDHTTQEEDEEAVKDTNTENSFNSQSLLDPTKQENCSFFNPFELNTYSKFGTNCLHESIRNKNFEICKLLLNYGANVDLPIYGAMTSGQSSNETSIVQSNCLCEALIQKEERIFVYLIENFTFSEFNYNLAFKICTKLGSASENTTEEIENFYTKNMLSHLLKLKTLSDSEYKVTLRNKSSFKQLVSSISSANVSNLGSNINFENGLILNWNGLDPKLVVVYESWLLNASRYFIISNRALRNSNSIDLISSTLSAAVAAPANTLINEEDFDINTIDDSQMARLNLNLKRLHLNVITRIDLSDNNLELIPFALFQIESLKSMKLSSNKLKKLPVNRSQTKKLDDVNNKLIKLEKSQHASTLTLTWNCNNLEELEIDKNQLTELPAQLFQIKALKHLNASHNLLEALPIELWLAPCLVELNVSFNQLNYLPLISKCIKDNLSRKQINNTLQQQQQPIIGRPNSSRSRRDEQPGRQRSVIPVDDHPLKGSMSQHEVSMPNKRQIQISYEEKPVQKANYWHVHTLDSSSTNSSIQMPLNDEQNSIDEKLNKTKKLLMEQKASMQQSQKESKLIELNLSNNKFRRIPECLSCLTPKLVKLNMSSNKLESMGAVCDLPSSLKFLDLSNNSLKRAMRLLNENLLKFIIFYFTKYSVIETSEQDSKQLTEQSMSSILLDNEFCYLNLFKKYFSTNDKPLVKYGTTSDRCYLSDKPPPLIREQRLNRDNYLIPNDSATRARDLAPAALQTSSSRLSVAASNIKRRARSQSRNHRNMIQTQANQLPGNNRRVLPFDLFLINLKYNRSYVIESNEDDFLMTAADILLEMRESDVDFVDLEKKEKSLINNQNLQIFMEQLCPHKRHVKLEHLKSLNVSQNKLKHFHMMFDLDANSKQQVSTPLNELNFISSHYPNAKSQENKSKKSNIESSDTDFSLSDSELSSLDDYDFLNEDLNASIDSKKSKTKLKEKLLESPLKKKLIDKKNKNLLSFNRNEEKVKMIAKLMFPNLTHLDFSSNRIRFIPGNLMFLENLSYLNTSSNKYLMRVSPKVGLLNKLWNFDLKNCDSLRDPANLDNLIKQRTKTADILGFLKVTIFYDFVQ